MEFKKHFVKYVVRAAVFASTSFCDSAANAGCEMSFADEFNKNVLDTPKWKTNDYWGNQTLSVNKEKQCYMPDVFSASGGILSLRAERRSIKQSQCKDAKTDLHYASGMITTAGCNPWEKASYCKTLKAFSQSYGYFEMRAKLPKGKGFWPAFWLLPANGGWPPEIDVME